MRLLSPTLLAIFVSLIAVAVSGQGLPAQGGFGTLKTISGAPIDVPFPPRTSASYIAGIRELRDAVYDFEPADKVDRLASMLNKATDEERFNPVTTALVKSRIADLTGRSWNEHGNKKMAIAFFETAWVQAKIALVAGETPLSLMAAVRAISSLCMVKDVTFVITYGPRISPYAQKTLELEPLNTAAAITLAAAKAYPPALFGGNPAKARAEILALIERRPDGFEKNELFDLRACMATACQKMGDTAQAKAWFEAALDLYPKNDYARNEMGKLTQ